MDEIFSRVLSDCWGRLCSWSWYVLRYRNTFPINITPLLYRSGDSCYKNDRQPGKCKLIYQCADAIRDLKQGIPRSLCKEGGRVDVVCCFEEQGGRQIQQLRNSQRPNPNTSQARLAEQSELIISISRVIQRTHVIFFILQSATSTVVLCLKPWKIPIGYETNRLEQRKLKSADSSTIRWLSGDQIRSRKNSPTWH